MCKIVGAWLQFVYVDSGSAGCLGVFVQGEIMTYQVNRIGSPFFIFSVIFRISGAPNYLVSWVNIVLIFPIPLNLGVRNEKNLPNVL